MRFSSIADIIYMPKYIKKFLFLVFLISILSFLVFLGINYRKANLASLSGVITAWVIINPLEVELSVPSEPEINKVFRVKAEVINKGKEKIEEMEAEIFLPEEIKLNKDQEQEMGSLAPESKKFISWPVKGEKPGNYIISVKVSGELREELIDAEDSVMVKIKKAQKRAWPPRWLQDFFNFFQSI